MAYDGDTLKKARKLAGLTQEQLAERIGSDDRSVSRWERNGLTDRSPYAGPVRRELHLDDPAVVRSLTGGAIPAQVDEPAGPPSARDLDDAELLAQFDLLLAEIKVRFVTRTDRRLYGQPASYPHHLDADPGQHDSGGAAQLG